MFGSVAFLNVDQVIFKWSRHGYSSWTYSKVTAMEKYCTYVSLLPENTIFFTEHTAVTASVWPGKVSTHCIIPSCPLFDHTFTVISITHKHGYWAQRCQRSSNQPGKEIIKLIPMIAPLICDWTWWYEDTVTTMQSSKKETQVMSARVSSAQCSNGGHLWLCSSHWTASQSEYALCRQFTLFSTSTPSLCFAAPLYCIFRCFGA